MKITVIISVYNNSSHLLKCLTSLNNQSLLPDEVILTDDGSQEDIRTIVSQNSHDYHFSLIFCQQADKGFRLASCKNNGIRLASNDLIVFLDQDIITSQNYLETINQYIKENNFLVSLPVRTNQRQLDQLSLDKIANFDYKNIITAQQFLKLKKQFRKEQFYYFLNKLHLRRRGVKLRGGCFATYKKNLVKINGFDENFVFWGNEDDDLGRRLANIGIHGYYPFRKDYAIHLYHPENHDGSRKNKKYYQDNLKKYQSGYYFCKYGLDNRKDDDELSIYRIRN